MMIHYVKQDITAVEKGIIFQGVNCQNKMNSGMAKDIKTKWPHVYEEFMNVPGSGMLGRMHPIRINDDLIVVNGYTQQNYGNDGKKYASPTAIAFALYDTSRLAHHEKMDIYLGRVGCGLGGLDWDTEVKRVIEANALDFPTINYYICDKPLT